MQEIKEQFKQDLHKITSHQEAEQLKVRYLGKKGIIQELMAELRNALASDRPLLGKKINDLKEEILLLCDQALQAFLEKEEEVLIQKEALDVTLPGRRRFQGKKHPTVWTRY
jgi:phenylalanyl-tRNA synthetase alpha chain